MSDIKQEKHVQSKTPKLCKAAKNWSPNKKKTKIISFNTAKSPPITINESEAVAYQSR